METEKKGQGRIREDGLKTEGKMVREQVHTSTFSPLRAVVNCSTGTLRCLQKEMATYRH